MYIMELTEELCSKFRIIIMLISYLNFVENNFIINHLIFVYYLINICNYFNRYNFLFPF